MLCGGKGIPRSTYLQEDRVHIEGGRVGGGDEAVLRHAQDRVQINVVGTAGQPRAQFAVPGPDTEFLAGAQECLPAKRDEALTSAQWRFCWSIN